LIRCLNLSQSHHRSQSLSRLMENEIHYLTNLSLMMN